MKILLIDDHSLFAEGLRLLLEGLERADGNDSASINNKTRHSQTHNRETMSEGASLTICCSCEQGLQQPSPESFELVLLDYYLPGLSGVEALGALREYYSNSQIIVVSALDDPQHIRKIIDAGAAGFIPKTSTFAVMSAALNLVLAGGTYLPEQAIEPTGMDVPAQQPNRKEPTVGLDCLSTRQREVLMQVVQGKPNKVIAKTLGISEHTVKAHISASFKLLGVRNRTEAVYAAALLNHRDLQRLDGAG